LLLLIESQYRSDGRCGIDAPPFTGAGWSGATVRDSSSARWPLLLFDQARRTSATRADPNGTALTPVGLIAQGHEIPGSPRRRDDLIDEVLADDGSFSR
jgi:hypothetical protein